MSQWIFEPDGNYVNFNGGGNLWRLHKDSNCISWHWDESGDLFFDVYDSEFVVKAGNIADVVIDGTPLTEAADFPTAIRAAFTGLGGGSSSYLVYVAELTQTGTAAPVATNHQNTMGFGEWTREFLGEYQSVSNVDYNLSKVWISGRFFGSSVINSFVEISTTGQLQYSFTIDFDNVGGKLAIYLTVTDDTGAEIDISSTGRDILLPEIRVYT